MISLHTHNLECNIFQMKKLELEIQLGDDPGIAVSNANYTIMITYDYDLYNEPVS